MNICSLFLFWIFFLKLLFVFVMILRVVLFCSQRLNEGKSDGNINCHARYKKAVT